MTALVPVILSGGAGTRLWPVSREALPKPFIRLPNGETLLQKTLRRALSIGPVATVLTVTSADYFFLTRIRPTGPETGYGYIEVGDAIADTAARRVARFLEKPDLAPLPRPGWQAAAISGMAACSASALPLASC